MNPLRRYDDLVLERVLDELIVFDKSNNRVHRLSAPVACVFEAADGTRTMEDLAALVASRLAVAPNNELVATALFDLQEAGLLEAATTRGAALATPPLSRRELSEKFLKAGLSAAMLPAIASIVAPTPAMARSHGTWTPESYSHELNSVKKDIANNHSTFDQDHAAQVEFSKGSEAGSKGIVDYSEGHIKQAENKFETADNYFGQVLKSLGL